MSDISTAKLDELFSALKNNGPISTDQIQQADEEYQKLKDIVVKGRARSQQSKPPPTSPRKLDSKNEADVKYNDPNSKCPKCNRSLLHHNALAETQDENNRLRKELYLRMNMCRELEEQVRRLKQNSGNLHEEDGVRNSGSRQRQKLGEQYISVFENEWMSTYRYMDNSLNMREDKILDKLLRILRAAYMFCDDISRAQMKNMEGEILCPLSTWTEDKRMEYVSSKTSLSETITKIAKLYRQTASGECIPTLQEAFISHILPEFLEKSSVDETVLNYCKRCVQITWNICIQDPPMNLISKVNRKANFDTNLFRFYAKVGDRFDFVVWPALLTQTTGDIVCKGVAQALDNSRYEMMQSPRLQDTSPRRASPGKVTPLAVLRGTTWGSQQSISARYTPSVELPPMPDEDKRETSDSPNFERPDPNNVHPTSKSGTSRAPLPAPMPPESPSKKNKKDASKNGGKKFPDGKSEKPSSFLGNSDGRLTSTWKYPSQNADLNKE